MIGLGPILFGLDLIPLNTIDRDEQPMRIFRTKDGVGGDINLFPIPTAESHAIILSPCHSFLSSDEFR